MCFAPSTFGAGGSQPNHASNPAQRLLTPLSFMTACAAMLNNTSFHCLYFCELDAVGHHVVLEAYAGLARVHQASVVGKVSFTGGGAVMTGYNAREWSTPLTPEHAARSPALAEAHGKWGGSKNLTRAELSAYLDSLFEMQSAANEITEVVYAQLPESIRKDEE